MHFTTAVVGAILAAASCIAAPVAQSETPNRPSQDRLAIYPAVTSQYNVWYGAIDYGLTQGLISKTGSSPDITTLLTFKIPGHWTGRTCRFDFELGASDPVPTGSQRADLFTSLAPAPGPTTTWPPGNRRDQFVGRFLAVGGGTATFEQGSPEFECPAGEVGYELVGVYDRDYIEWNIHTGGPVIRLI